MSTKRSLEDTKPKLVYHKSSNSWIKNGQPIKEGYKYYDSKVKQTRVFRNGQFINENDDRFNKTKYDALKRKASNLALKLFPVTTPLAYVREAIDAIAEIGTKRSGGNDVLPDLQRYTGLHRFGPSRVKPGIGTNRSPTISGHQSRGNQAILEYYLTGIDRGLNRSKQNPIKIIGNKAFDKPNVDYNFLPVDTLVLTDDWKPTIDSLSNEGLQNINNYYFVDYDRDDVVDTGNRSRYKDKTVYDYGRAKAKVLKDKKGNYSLRTIDLFDTGKTVGPLGIVLEALKKTYPLVIRHDNPIKFISRDKANSNNQDNDLLYNIMIRE